MVAPTARRLGVAVVLLAGIVGCDTEPPPQPAVGWAPQDVSYVGAETCEPCHAEAFRRWRGSHHDLAMQIAGPETVLGDFDDAEFTHFGVTSRFFRRDGRFFVSTDGRDGAPHDFEVTHTFGVEPLQQYLITFPDGRRQALGMADRKSVV